MVECRASAWAVFEWTPPAARFVMNVCRKARLPRLPTSASLSLEARHLADARKGTPELVLRELPARLVTEPLVKVVELLGVGKLIPGQRTLRV
jgi:hypothetical protein